MIRNAVYQWVYSQAPGASEGYTAARSLGAKLAHLALENALQSLPATPDEATAYITANEHTKNPGPIY